MLTELNALEFSNRPKIGNFLRLGDATPHLTVLVVSYGTS